MIAASSSKGPWVENGEDLGMRPADGRDNGGAGPGEQLGQLASSIAVEGLKESPVPGGWQSQLFVGEIGGPSGP
jgi:hypothetical protein